MAYDPWDWANSSSEKKEAVIGAPLSNVIVPLQASNEQMQPGQVIQEQPNKDAEQLRSMAINKGVDKGVSYVSDKYAAMKAGPIGTGGAPVVEQSIMASSPTIAAPAGTMAGMGTGTAAAAATEAAVTAPLATTALTPVAAGAAGGAAEASMLAGMGPVGWGVGALLLAKSMNWI